MQYSFNLNNQMATDGLISVLHSLLKEEKPPVVLCIGSDLVSGDSLGPIVGTLLAERTKELPVYVYGSLSAPVTAKEIKYVNTFLRRTHPDRKVLAIDAAVGGAGEAGLIRVQDSPVFPGSGANKKLEKTGDVSVLGIVTEKTPFRPTSLGAIRIRTVYRMAQIVADAVAAVLWNKCTLSSQRVEGQNEAPMPGFS